MFDDKNSGGSVSLDKNPDVIFQNISTANKTKL